LRRIKWIAKERQEKYLFEPDKAGAATTLETSEFVKFAPGE
jgi:hypothetical protein